MNNHLYKAITLAFFTVLLVPSFASASLAKCEPVYGGGITKEQVCDGKKVTVPPPATNKATPTPTKSPTTTKGGLTVAPQTPQRSTPSTGPEVLGLIGLLPAAGIGYYLRKKR